MTNRYTNLDGTKKISATFGEINNGFDTVQSEIDAHRTAATIDHPDGSVKTAKLADKGVTQAKIADKAVGQTQLADGAVGAGQLGANAVTDAAIGSRTITDSASPTADTGSPTSLFSWLGYMIKAITGKSTWRTPPAKTLEDLNTHIGSGGTSHAVATTTTAGFQSAADKSKLDGISAGAKVNQNAFSKVSVSGQSDVAAASETDTLTLAGGIGITITTDAPTKKAIITATGTSTPGAHAVSHITGGTDVIPNAVAGGASGLLSGSDKTVLNGLSAANPTAVTLNQGVAAYTASRRSRLRINKMAGRTLVNLWGRLGNFSALAGLSVSNSTGSILANGGVDGRNALTVTNSSSGPFVYSDIASLVAGGKYYIAIVNAKLGTAPDAQIGLSATGFGTTSTSYGTANATGFTPIYRKIAVTGTGTAFRVGSYTSASTVGQTVQFDGFRIYEITAAEYAAIDTMTAAQVTARWPYVDDMKHTNAVFITNAGKNLLPPFADWTMNANAAINEAYKMTLTATGINQQSWIAVTVVPSATYTVSGTFAGRITIFRNSSSGVTLASMNNDLTVSYKSVSVTIPSDVTLIYVAHDNSSAVPTGTFAVSSLQLELGTSATTFEPKRGSYLYLPDCQPRSNVDGSVADSLYTDGQGRPRVTRQFREVVLDGSFTWGLSLDKVGYKLFSILWSTTGLPLGFEGSSKLRAVKYNGNPLANSYSVDTVDTAYFSASSANFAVSVPDSDTGFGEDYAPSSASGEIKAFFYGWKMNNGTFGTPYNGTGVKTWTRWDATSNAGAVTVVPTDYAASTYTPYRLMYQLAVSVDEPVNYEGDLILHEGGNQIEVGTGIIPREIAKPTLNGTSYAINNNVDKPASNLLYRTDKILSVYRGSTVDKKWILITDANAYGRQRLAIAVADFDPSSPYSIAYLALDTYSIGIAPQTIDADYAPNVKESGDSLERSMSDTRTAVSVLQNTSATTNGVAMSIGTHAANTSHVPFAATTGAANTYAAILSPAPTAYSLGMGLSVMINVANTGAATININGLGAKAIVDAKGNALLSGKLVAGGIYTLRYNGTSFGLQGDGGDDINGQMIETVTYAKSVLLGDPIELVQAGSLTPLPSPSVLPSGLVQDTAFSPDGNYVAYACSVSPFVLIYKRGGDVFSKLANPAILPTGTGNAVAFSQDGVYLAIAHSTTPYVTIYKRSGDTFTKLSDPVILPTGQGNGVTFSLDGVYLSVTHANSPYVTIYKRSGDTFTKLADPTTLISGGAAQGKRSVFSPDGTVLAVVHFGTTFLTIYKRSGDVFNKLADPAYTPVSSGYCITFSPDGNYLAVGSSGGSGVALTIYKRVEDTFVRLANFSAPVTIVYSVAFSPDGNYLVFGSSVSPYVFIYQRSGDVFTKIADPSTLPTFYGLGVSVSSDGLYLSVATSSSPTYIYLYKFDLIGIPHTTFGDWRNSTKIGYAREGGTAGETKQVVITHR